MREKVSYDNYYDKNGRSVYEIKTGVGPLGAFIISFSACAVGYFFGYKKARTTAKSIFNNILEKCTDERKEFFKDLWNEAVDQYFDKK